MSASVLSSPLNSQDKQLDNIKIIIIYVYICNSYTYIIYMCNFLDLYVNFMYILNFFNQNTCTDNTGDMWESQYKIL